MNGWKLCNTVICLSLILVAYGCGSDDAAGPEDETPQVVSSTYPPDGATDVPVDVVITVTFLEDMDPASITDTTFTLSYNPLVPASVTYDAGSRTATLTPDDLLLYETAYTVRVSAEPAVPAEKGLPATTIWEWGFISIPGGAGLAALPRTGQTRVYSAGDDGSLQAGIEWPVPRFTDNGDGTITDNLTGLMWLKDADCLYHHIFNAAVNEADSLNYSPEACGCQDYTANYTDWRLPNVNELESLVHGGQAHTANWLMSQGFVNVHALYYWTSTTFAYNTWYGCVVNLWVGYVDRQEKNGYQKVWAVRGETTAPARIWKTGQTTSYAPRDDGDLQAGTDWPSPRFYPTAGNAAYLDIFTGLVWPADAGTSTIGECEGGYMTWQAALDYVACLNSREYLGCSDWRLPNRKELYSLIDHSKYNPALPQDHHFEDVQLGNYWTSTTYAYDTSRAWIVWIQYGDLSPWDKTVTAWVWPVRGGQ